MSKNTAKKKTSWIKRIFKYIGILLVLLIAAIILIPVFFKDELKQIALDEANKMLKTTVEVDDFDLTLFSTFPDMTLSFDGVRMTGKDDFEGVKLVDLKRFEAELGFWSVIDMEDIEIRSVKLIEPQIHVKVLPNGLANYDIMKSSEELAEEEVDTTESAFKLGLNHYEIQKGHIVYEDQLSPMYAKIVNLNHEGNGDLTADVIDFSTTTSMDALTYSMDGVDYLSAVKTDLDMDLKMAFKDGSSRFELKENKLSLNALDLSFDGYYEMFEGYDDMDLTLNADQTSFKDLLSLIPAFYHTGYESMVADGSMSLNGFVKGRLDASNLPAFEVGTKITNAQINYPDMPASIDNIAVVAGATFPGGASMDAIEVNVDQLKAAFAGNTIDANFYMKHPMTDPYMKSKVLADVDLATLGKVMPLAENETYNGKLTSDLQVEGRLSTLEKEEYEKFDASGALRLEQFEYASEDLPAPVDVEDMLFEFSPQRLHLANMNGTMGATDFKMNGDVENYMAYVFNEGDLRGTFNYHSDVLNIDELMPAAEESEETTSEDVDTTATTSGSEQPVLVPANIDFVMNTTVEDLVYDGMDIKKIDGKVYLRNEEAVLEQLTMNAMGGKVGLNGKYNTQDHQQAKMDFAYSLEEVNIQDLAEHFNTIDKLAPIAKYARGKISSDFSMNTDVQPNFEPVYNSLTGNGNLLASKVMIEDFKPLEKLASVTKMQQLSDQTLKNVRTRFEFKDGKVEVKPFDVKFSDKIKTNISGT
ncbi:MAG: AsmA-like C-terminal region-containing protein, partial [Bacteroidota bacterium]